MPVSARRARSKAGGLATLGAGSGGGDGGEEALYLAPKHLVIGATIDVYGRAVHLRSCDPWTREWYAGEEAARAYECAPQPPNLLIEESVPAPPAMVVPPHTGFGSEEDSMQSVYTFNVKPLKRNLTKWALHDGIVYKWSAKVITTSVLDTGRRFIIALYPADDTMAVFEVSIRNSGFKGGQFLRRDKYHTSAGAEYTPPDFAAGRRVTILSHVFEVLGGADPETRAK